MVDQDELLQKYGKAPQKGGLKKWQIIFGLLSLPGLVFFYYWIAQFGGDQNYKQTSESMLPTLLVGDYVTTNLLAYSSDEVQRGDIVAFRVPDREDVIYIKRVIGIPGDSIEFSGGFLFLNNERVDSFEDAPLSSADSALADHLGEQRVMREYLGERSYQVLYPKTESRFGAMDENSPVQLEDDEYFVMGDFRANSRDSRVFGPISRSSILGRAETIMWNTNKPGRFGLTLE